MLAAGLFESSAETRSSASAYGPELARLCLCLLHVSKRFTDHIGRPIQLKIGIHFGKLVGGVSSNSAKGPHSSR